MTQKKKILPGEILRDDAYYERIAEIQKSIKDGTHPEVRLNKGGSAL